jgi:transcriptional regulator with AAA-type ATPase domain
MRWCWVRWIFVVALRADVGSIDSSRRAGHRYLNEVGVAVALLELTRGDRVVLRYRLRSGRTVIGRSDRCDVALPSDSLSRTHCVVDEDAGWWLTDRSRHGTFVDGRRIEGRVRLELGATFTLGDYAVRLRDDAPTASATMTRLATPADFEELVEVADDALARRAVLHILDGDAAGTSHELVKPVVWLGGREADVLLSHDLPIDACRLRVVRGRVIAEPGSWPVYLDGGRLREPTPVWENETLRVGGVTVELRSAIAPSKRRSLDSFGDLVGRSPPMVKLFTVLDRISRHHAPVLLLGESGTGKELAARALHDLGTRSDGPFVPINCASIPETLVDSHLFGHEKGAFTGADQRRDGAFQRAHGGTLFLDELGEMTPDTQARLLRALESGEVLRVGGAAPEHPDVRVVAATNRDLGQMVLDGKFRSDLYHRLAVLAIRMPPLREHREDVPELVAAIMERDHPGVGITAGALVALSRHDWPGNVRELRNVLTRAVVLGGDPVDVDDLSFAILAAEAAPLQVTPLDERAELVAAIEAAGGNRTAAARRLGIPRTSLVYKLMRYGIA